MKHISTIAAAVLLCVAAWRHDSRAFLAAYLAAWWFWIGIAMGGLANVWLHNLTGGKWGEAVRGPLLAMTQHLGIAALLFAPILAGMHELYPWAADAGRGAGRWSAELSYPAFKSAWLMPGFFLGRSIACLLLWTLLAWMTHRPGWQRSRPFSAAALILYGFSVSIAAVDWVMSLMPLWYSSVFGWLAGVGQMLAGMAAAIVLVAHGGNRRPAALFRDLGNLLFMYVMTWAYLTFVQFLIIWAENLPHEIAWYLARSHGAWLVMAWMLALLLFAAPLLVLLSRHAKDSPKWLARLAAFILLMQLVDSWWLVLPSVQLPASSWLWSAPLAAFTLGAIAWATGGRSGMRDAAGEAPHG